MEVECPAIQSEGRTQEHHLIELYEFYSDYATDYSKGHVVSIMIAALTQEMLDGSLDAFNFLVDSLVVKQVGDMQDLDQNTPSFDTAVQSVMIDETEVDLDLKSSSTVSNFSLDEESKTISFNVEGQNGSKGVTVLKIGNVVEGPYVVTIDGSPATSSEFVIIENPDGQSTAMLVYSHNVHEISITGTQVVPELSMAAIAILAMVIGGVVMMGRSGRFFS